MTRLVLILSMLLLTLGCAQPSPTSYPTTHASSNQTTPEDSSATDRSEGEATQPEEEVSKDITAAPTLGPDERDLWGVPNGLCTAVVCSSNDPCCQMCGVNEWYAGAFTGFGEPVKFETPDTPSGQYNNCGERVDGKRVIATGVVEDGRFVVQTWRLE